LIFQTIPEGCTLCSIFLLKLLAFLESVPKTMSLILKTKLQKDLTVAAGALVKFCGHQIKISNPYQFFDLPKWLDDN